MLPDEGQTQLWLTTGIPYRRSFEAFLFFSAGGLPAYDQNKKTSPYKGKIAFSPCPRTPPIGLLIPYGAAFFARHAQDSIFYESPREFFSSIGHRKPTRDQEVWKQLHVPDQYPPSCTESCSLSWAFLHFTIKKSLFLVWKKRESRSQSFLQKFLLPLRIH